MNAWPITNELVESVQQITFTSPTQKYAIHTDLELTIAARAIILKLPRVGELCLWSPHKNWKTIPMVNKVTPWNTYFGVIYKPTPCRRLSHSPQSIHFHRDVTSFFTGFYREVALRAKASKGGINWQAGKSTLWSPTAVLPVEPQEL